MKNLKQIIIVDDHHLIRAGLKEQLCVWFEGVSVLEASTTNDAWGKIADCCHLDLAIIDLFLPEGDGFKFIRKLCTRLPDLPVLVLSSSQNPTDIRKALAMGAKGYITKATTAKKVLSAIKRVMAGGIYVPVSAKDQPVTTGPINTLESVKTQLTERQLEILLLIAEGLPNKLIARRCNLSYNTVKVHVSAILQTLGLDNRIQATILVNSLGLQAPDLSLS